MPVPGSGNVIAYTLEWTNVEGALMTVVIHDSLQEVIDEGWPDINIDYLPLSPGGEPLIIRYNNPSEDLNNPILGRSAIIQFQNTISEFLSTFSGGEDNRFYVTISKAWNTINAVPIFQGFLVQEDNSEPYLPPGQIVTLMATDNLGLLKGVELTKIDGTKFRGKNKVIDYVVACLRKTGLSIYTNVVVNLFEDSHADRTVATNKCPWNQTYYDALTHEKEINEADDCYTVLSQILTSWKCRLSYYKGAWWIVRIDEYKNSLVHYSTYTEAGVVITDGTIDASLLKVMGHESTADILFKNKETNIRLQRERKFDKEIFNFKYAKEIICNINFERGTIITDTVILKTYNPECWTLYKGWPNVTLDATGYIKVVSDAGGYESGRSLFMAETPASDFYYFASDDWMPVVIKDKFSFSVDFRYSTDLGGGTSGSVTLAQVQFRLHGDDGSKWNMDTNGKWFQSNAAFLTNQKYLSYIGTPTIDFGEWNNISVDSEPIPATGEIEILLLNNDDPDDQDKEFQNLTFVYNPYIDQSYIANDGEYYKVSQTGNYSANNENELFLSDSLRKIFKGAMFVTSEALIATYTTTFSGSTFTVSGDKTGLGFFTRGIYIRIDSPLNDGIFHTRSSVFSSGPNTTLVTVTETFVAETSVNATYYRTLFNLTSGWNDWALVRQGVTGLGVERFGKWQAYSAWNQLKTPKRIFDVSLKGLNSNTMSYCDIIHKYQNDVSSLHNVDKFFVFLHMEQNWRTCQWTGTLIEIEDTTETRNYDDPFEFKYLTK